jgi:23S rRNA (uracil1939-C5)-methyltransferase
MKELLLTLDKFTYGAAAMGRAPEPDGRAVFVPFGIPGELVRVRLIEEKRGFAHAELLEVLDASPQRTAPRCRHFGECGGCHYQHLPYEAQLAAKIEILRDQLGRIGKIKEPPVGPIVPSPKPWNYRNHVQFHLTGDGKLGYVGLASAGSVEPSREAAVVPITECHLPEDRLDALWPQLGFEADASEVPEPLVERVSLRAGSDDLMVVLESHSLEAPEMELEAGISVVHISEQDVLVMAGEDHLTLHVLGRDFRVSAGSFFQVNTSMAEAMVKCLLEVLPLPTEALLEVYCGVGFFSAFLAPHCQRLIGIEISPSACNDFQTNLDEFDHVELYEGMAEQVIPALNGRLDTSSHGEMIVLVDPPRAGLKREVLDGIVTLKPGTIAYVSCDPATLARDAARLIKGGYRLEEVRPFDLFPQTYHIESISIFKGIK